LTHMLAVISFYLHVDARQGVTAALFCDDMYYRHSDEH